MQKLIAKIIAKRLQVACEQFSLLKREQAVFTRTGEYVSQVTTLLECCQKRKGKGKILCFLDLRKAYDLLPHHKYIEKLRIKKLRPNLINFIQIMYKNTKIKFKIGSNKSNPFNYERGVRKGYPTSPILFNLYINDILEDIKPIDVEGLQNGFRGLMFADNTVIAASDLNNLKCKLDIIKN